MVLLLDLLFIFSITYSAMDYNTNFTGDEK